jgi:Cof subfamily protein (haloacid dehalogenase superfamily)
MYYRLVASDLDGTLLDPESRIPEATADAVREYRRLGGHFILATGRSEISARPYADQLGLDGPIVSYNGGKLVSLSTGEVFYETFLDAGKAMRAYRALRALGKDVLVYCGGAPHAAEKTAVTERYQRRVNMEIKIIADARDVINESTKKLLVIDPLREFVRMSDALRPIFGDGMNCVSSEKEYFEVMPPDTSKGRGLLAAAELLGVPAERTAAVGDYVNDVSMIEAAGLGVAVANAAQAAIGAAGYVTASNREDGVGKLLRRIMAGEL